jgi:hypothetical protein
MNKTSLSTICTVNITILSIFTGLIIIFYFFVFEKMENINSKLDSSRHEIEALFINNPQLLWIPLTGNIEIDCRKYFSENKTNYKLLYILLNGTLGFQPKDKEKAYLKQYELDYDFLALSEIDRIGLIISIIDTLTIYHPYSNKAIEVNKYNFSSKPFNITRDEFTEELFKAIRLFNEIFFARKPQILKYISWYQNKEESFQSGNSSKEQEMKIRNSHLPFETVTFDFNYWIKSSYEKFEYIQLNIMNDIASNFNLLKRYQKYNISKIKDDAIYRGTLLLFIGIFFPLILMLINFPNDTRLIEFFIILISFTIYLETFFHFKNW